ncbi:MAG: ATP-binding protein, partial [Thermoanaerobaculia bacterium]
MSAVVRNLPIRRKVSLIVMLTVTMALVLACTAFIVYDYGSDRRSMADDVDTLAKVLASNSAASLIFHDPEAAGEILSAVRAQPSIRSAAIYDRTNRPFVTYGQSDVRWLPRDYADHVVIGADSIQTFRTIRFRGEAIGTLYLAADLRELQTRMRLQIVVGSSILAATLFLALLLTRGLQRLVTDPLLDLARAAGRVTREKNYSIRVTAREDSGADEIAALKRAFNNMLEEIESRDEALRRHQAELSGQVEQRTSELHDANRALVHAKDIAETVAEINAQLSRQSALILNTATDGIVGIDLDGQLTFLNPAAAAMFGKELADFQHMTVHTAIHYRPDGTHLNDSSCLLGYALRRGESLTRANDEFCRSDGTAFPVEYSATPMRDEQGRVLGSVLTFRDVSEQRAIEKMKDEFVSTVSHELRTPLTSIRGALGLLKSGLLGSVEAKGQRMLEIAVSNTDRLVRLINDILDLERIDSGQFDLSRDPIDAHALMAQAVDGVQTVADAAGVRLVLEPVDAILWVDADRILQTLTNLLGNAIKFSLPSTTVTISGLRKDEMFTFRVADSGRGIPANKVDTIFERFQQVDASDSRDKGGSGLGLAICRSIVNAHGGRIWTEPNGEQGSVFLFTVPVSPTSTAASLTGELIGPKTLLVCEEEGPATSWIVATLRKHGFVVLVTSADNVLAGAEANNPDGIIVNLGAEFDAAPIVDMLKGHPRTRNIPIGIATADPQASLGSFAGNVRAWIRMPLQWEDVLSAVAKLCWTPQVLIVEDDADLARVMSAALQARSIRTM